MILYVFMLILSHLCGSRSYIRSSFRLNSNNFKKLFSSLDNNVKDDKINNEPVNQFVSLGLVPDLVNGLYSQGISIPTPVQRAVIPRLLYNEDIVMAASTGSGKTFAYILPTLQALHGQEMSGYQRLVRRPRCLVLVPTRELAQQV